MWYNRRSSSSPIALTTVFLMLSLRQIVLSQNYSMRQALRR
jgi:hypothetical protein